MASKITVEQVMEAIESGEYVGFCTACGEQADGIEPDARKYRCGSCGQRAVYGAEELLLSASVSE